MLEFGFFQIKLTIPPSGRLHEQRALFLQEFQERALDLRTFSSSSFCCRIILIIQQNGSQKIRQQYQDEVKPQIKRISRRMFVKQPHADSQQLYGKAN